MSNIIWAGSNPQDSGREIAGGKGLNLLRLYNLARQTGMFEVPNFFIVPADFGRRFISSRLFGEYVDFEGDAIKDAYALMNKPVAVRSSSPLEDGINASFAGMFKSDLNVNSYLELASVARDVYFSAFHERVERYSARMGINFSDAMAIIVQEQVTDALEWGIIQLEDYKAVTETFDRRGRGLSHETEYEFLDEFFPEGFKWEIKPESGQRDWIGKGEFLYATHCAREAKKRLGLDGIVQVEFFLSPAKLPRFVQIRQLPTTKSYAAQLDMDIPEGVPYIESQICNDVAGELVLPAYVTISQSGLKTILTETGQSFFITLNCGGFGEMAEKFIEKSNLARNKDFNQFKSMVTRERLIGLEESVPYYNKAWQEGNNLFDDYILVCDHLDETPVGMADLTTNKRAIITCLEASKTSHAMTVARDLGIMCMGVEGDITDLNFFYHQVETGDIVHMKSDGRRAVAYIERKRESNPYQNLKP